MATVAIAFRTVLLLRPPSSERRRFTHFVQLRVSQLPVPDLKAHKTKKARSCTFRSLLLAACAAFRVPSSPLAAFPPTPVGAPPPDTFLAWYGTGSALARSYWHTQLDLAASLQARSDSADALPCPIRLPCCDLQVLLFPTAHCTMRCTGGLSNDLCSRQRAGLKVKWIGLCTHCV